MCKLSSVLYMVMSLFLIKMHEKVVVDGEDRLADMLQEYGRVF